MHMRSVRRGLTAAAVPAALALLLTSGASVAAAGDSTDRWGGDKGGGHHDAATITSEPWGTTGGGEAVERYTLSNKGMTVRILTYGGIIQTLEVALAGSTAFWITVGMLAAWQAQRRGTGRGHGGARHGGG